MAAWLRGQETACACPTQCCNPLLLNSAGGTHLESACPDDEPHCCRNSPGQGRLLQVHARAQSAGISNQTSRQMCVRLACQSLCVGLVPPIKLREGRGTVHLQQLQPPLWNSLDAYLHWSRRIVELVVMHDSRTSLGSTPAAAQVLHSTAVRQIAGLERLACSCMQCSTYTRPKPQRI